MRLALAFASITLLACTVARAEGVHATARIPNVECKMLTLGPEQLQNPANLPLIYDQPSPRARVIGRASGIVIAVAPPRIVGGYVQILHLDGHWGWMRADLLKPYHAEANPNAHCQPVMLSNGRIGFDT